MKKSYLILAAAAVGALFASCDDFLDDNRMPMTSIVDDPAYWSTSANVQLQLDRMLSGSPLYSGYSGWYYFKYLNDDQVGASFENWPYPTLPADVGEYDFSTVRGANYIINNVVTSSLAEADKNNYWGIARLIRATAYYRLVRMFGDITWENYVPDVNDPILQAPRTNRDIVMDSVLADLDFAIATISADKAPLTWSKDLARATKSEVCLYEGTFCRYRTEADNGVAPNEERAKKYLTEAANVSKDLLGKYGFCDDYHSLYNSTWEKMKTDLGEVTGLSTNPELIFGRRYDINLQRHSTISYTASSTTTSGMSLDAFKAFLMKDGKAFADSEDQSLEGVPTELNFGTAEEPDMQPAYSIQNLLDNREARLSIITDPYVYFKGMEWSRAGCSGMNSSSGFGIAKYDNVLLPVTARTNASQNYTSCPIYWQSYIALNYAEAKAELGDFTNTDFDISLKKLYERAGLDMITDVDYLKNLNASDNNMGVSSLLWEIRRCRRCVTMFDNWIRYWDLIRWHQLDKLDTTKYPDIIRGAYVLNSTEHPQGQELVNGYVQGNMAAGGRKYDKKYYLYPIGTNQLNLNLNLKQNPGW